MARIELVNLNKSFGAVDAVKNLNFVIEDGEFVVFVGPSGCGKTTTLRMIAGFLTASSGDIMLDGESILDLPAYRRDMGIVFQSYALFPYMTVARNVRFGLEMRRMPKAAAATELCSLLPAFSAARVSDSDVPSEILTFSKTLPVMAVLKLAGVAVVPVVNVPSLQLWMVI